MTQPALEPQNPKLHKLTQLKKLSGRINDKLVAEITELTQAKALTQTQAARHLGVSQSTISRAVRKRRQTSTTKPTQGQRTASDIVEDAALGLINHDELLHQLRNHTYIQAPRKPAHSLLDEYDYQPNSVDAIQDAYFLDLINQEELTDLLKSVNAITHNS